MQSFLRLVRFLSLAFAGVFAGFLVGVAVLESSLRHYGGAVYTQVRLVELDRLDVLASVTLIPALVATVLLVLAGLRARNRAFWLTLAAVVLLVTVFAVSLAVNLPINAAQASWHPQAPPADWAAVRDRWQAAHAVRAGAALLAFGLLGAAVLSREPAPAVRAAV
jgi:uncharacterized membrane protein